MGAGFYLAVMLTSFLLCALIATMLMMKPSPEADRFMAVVTSRRSTVSSKQAKLSPQDWLLEIAGNLRARFGLSENPKLMQRLEQAGLRTARGREIFFAVQMSAPLLLGVAGTFSPINTIFCVIAGAVTGYMAPDFWLGWKQNGRKTKIRRSLPDALDLLVICVDAGLGFDQAMLRVGDELALSHPEINEEFSQVTREQRAGKPRLEAWQTLADRSGIEEVSAFVSMLIQADRFGTPIVKSLSRFSEELRSKRRAHAEEKAAQTKIKIIFPLVLFIFPCLFIVLLAPALLSIGSGLKGLGS